MKYPSHDPSVFTCTLECPAFPHVSQVQGQEQGLCPFCCPLSAVPWAHWTLTLSSSGHGSPSLLSPFSPLSKWQQHFLVDSVKILELSLISSFSYLLHLIHQLHLPLFQKCSHAQITPFPILCSEHPCSLASILAKSFHLASLLLSCLLPQFLLHIEAVMVKFMH